MEPSRVRARRSRSRVDLVRVVAPHRPVQRVRRRAGGVGVGAHVEPAVEHAVHDLPLRRLYLAGDGHRMPLAQRGDQEVVAVRVVVARRLAVDRDVAQLRPTVVLADVRAAVVVRVQEGHVDVRQVDAHARRDDELEARPIPVADGGGEEQLHPRASGNHRRVGRRTRRRLTRGRLARRGGAGRAGRAGGGRRLRLGAGRCGRTGRDQGKGHDHGKQGLAHCFSFR